MSVRNALAAAALTLTLLSPLPASAAPRVSPFFRGASMLVREIAKQQAKATKATIQPKTPEARRDTILGIPSVGTKYRCRTCGKFHLRKQQGEMVCPTCQKIIDRARKIGKAAWVRADNATGPTLRYLQATAEEMHSLQSIPGYVPPVGGAVVP